MKARNGSRAAAMALKINRGVYGRLMSPRCLGMNRKTRKALSRWRRAYLAEAA